MDRPYARYSSTATPGAATTRGAGTGRYTNVETDSRHETDIRDYDEYDDGYDDGYDDIYEYEDPIDRRWIWVAGVAGAILLIAVICTVVILGGGDSGSVSKTVMATTPTPPVATSTSRPAMTSAAPAPPPVAPLSPETVTTVAPSPTPSASADPAPAVAAPSPNAFTYQVTGTRPLLDLVTVVYTDAQGALQTEFNVALPWSRTVTLDPGVELKSVTATSLTGQLNCAITDASGAAIVAQATNSMITTCTK